MRLLAPLAALAAALAARAAPDPHYGTLVSPVANTTVKLDGSTLLDLQYYGVGGPAGSGLASQNIRVYLVSFAAPAAPGTSGLSGDARYGLLPFLELPPNAFQPGTSAGEIAAHAFNAYNYSRVPLPRADVTSAFAINFALLETYSAPGGNGLNWQNRAGSVPLNVVPA